MDRLRTLLGGLKPETEKLLLRLIQNSLEKSDLSLINLILTIARNGRLVGLANTYGISLLAKIPPGKLRALRSEGVEFVLAAADAPGTEQAAEILLTRSGPDRPSKNWLLKWTTGNVPRRIP